jgi:hypothetical protein
MLDPLAPAAFVPTPELADWVRRTFVEDGAPLLNEEHLHLRAADIGFLWTNVQNRRQGRTVLGQAELGTPQGANGGAWGRARALIQRREWFGEVPDFIITLDAGYGSDCSPAEFCALVEHELYHCAQAKDPFGMPRFHRDGSPVFTMRGHDVEEFVGVVRRYGADAAHVRALVDAANRPPEVAGASIAQACGTCLLRALSS